MLHRLEQSIRQIALKGVMKFTGFRIQESLPDVYLGQGDYFWTGQGDFDLKREASAPRFGDQVLAAIADGPP